MLIYKLIGGGFLLLSGFITSRAICKRDEDGVLRCEALGALIFEIKKRIEGYCMPLSDIIIDIDPGFFVRCGYDMENLPRSIGEIKEMCPFSGDEELFRIFDVFFSSLGSGYKGDELFRCNTASEEAGRLASERAALKEQKKKTVPVLVMSLAFGIALLLF